MNRIVKALSAAVVVVLAGAGVASAQFMASDLLYVPAVAHSDGENDTHWRTDLVITNVDSVPVDVAVFFVPTGNGDNSGFLTTRDEGLGGSADDGFGLVNEALNNIPPGGTVRLVDLVGEYWIPKLGGRASIGALVIFAWEHGTLDNDGNRTFRNITAYTRTYNATKIWVPDPDNQNQFIQKDATYGQVIPAVPWYNLVDAGAKTNERDLTFQVLAGGQENAAFRYNVGIFNTSDLQTTISVLIQPFDASGQALVDENNVPKQRTLVLGPLGQVQLFRPLANDFGLSDVTDILLKISFLQWSTTGTNPVPTFTTYGSLIDNESGDPTTILPTFGFPYDISKVWNVPATTTAAISRLGFPMTGGVEQRPLHLPPR